MLKKRTTSKVPGYIKITDDTLSILVANTVMKVDGVVAMSSNVVDGLTSFLGLKNMTQGVKIVNRDGKSISFTVYIIAKYGYRIPDVALKIQEQVKTTVEKFTDSVVTSVNVYVQELLFDEAINND